MRLKLSSFVSLCCLLVLSLTIAAGTVHSDGDRGWDICRDSDHHEHNLRTPLSILGVIPISGSPMKSSDIIFADPGTERVYLSDRTNAGEDVFDAEANVYLGRVPGFVGAAVTNGGGTATTNDRGPNGVLVTPSKLLWAGDGNSIAQVADVDPDHTSTYLKIIHSIDTSNPECNGGTPTTRFCGRADELGYDPADHIIAIANDEPLAISTKLPSTVAVAPYLTFISTDTYGIMGQMLFTGAGGLEQPVWDAELHSFLVVVPGSSTQASALAVVKIHGHPYSAALEHMYPLGPSSCTSANGAALGPFQHVLVSACGVPKIVNALNGTIITTITQVNGGDEVGYNSGDGRFYVASTDLTAPTPQPSSLGVIDAETSTWLQNVDSPGAKEVTAFAENNHIFSSALAPSTTPDTTVCAKYGYPGTGCVIIYTHGDDDH